MDDFEGADILRYVADMWLVERQDLSHLAGAEIEISRSAVLLFELFVSLLLALRSYRCGFCKGFARVL